MASQAKYRPSLTAVQIAKIVSLCKQETPMSLESMTIVGTLAPFQAKIENAGIQPAYTTSPPETVEAKLGMTAPATDYNGFESKEAYWLDCYVHYCDEPTHCTLEVIKAAKEHMYINDLMSPEEIAEFESKNY